MKKSLFVITSIFLSSTLFFGCHKTAKSENSDSKEVTIYTYDSFVSEWGPGSKIAEKFEQKTGIKANFVDCGDGVQLLSRAILEKDNVQADVILGLDNNTAPKAISSEILSAYKPKDADILIPNSLYSQMVDEKLITPYDYSHFALIFDTRSNLPEPKSLSDLTNPVYKNKIIIMDPRTSTPGLGFVAWTRAIFNDDDSFTKFWTELKPNLLTMAPGWSSGYGLFTAGEAPIVTSYSTSPAANLEYDKIDYYKALVFEEGHYIQVEGAAILKNAPHRKAAEEFMDFLVSEDAQNELPLTQWMYPANVGVTLPDCYEKAATKPAKTVTTDIDKLDQVVEKVISILN